MKLMKPSQDTIFVVKFCRWKANEYIELVLLYLLVLLNYLILLQILFADIERLVAEILLFEIEKFFGPEIVHLHHNSILNLTSQILEFELNFI